MSVSSKEEPEVVERISLVKHAALAPSSHNTQPWCFAVAEDSIQLYADRTRALPANDPDDRELVISCGCALMNLRVAAARANLPIDVTILPDEKNEDLLADAQIGTAAEVRKTEAELFSAMPGRRTYRKRFQDKQVPAELIETLSAAASREGAWLAPITSEQARQEVASLVAEGDAIQWANPSWRRELALWMHSRRQGDGLTLPGPILPVARAVVRTFDMGNGVGAKDKQLAAESPLLAVLGTDQDGVVDWLHAGQALESVLLNACRAGVQASYLNQPIQVSSLRPKLQQILTTTGFPQILLRCGFPRDEMPATPRRPLDDVLKDREKVAFNKEEGGMS